MTFPKFRKNEDLMNKSNFGFSVLFFAFFWIGKNACFQKIAFQARRKVHFVRLIFRYFGSHRDRTLLKVVMQLPGCHEDRIHYLLIVLVSIFASCKNRRYILHWFLEWEFMSFDDEYCTHHLASRRYVEQHRFGNTWCVKDWGACQQSFYFFQSGCSRIHPFKVVGMSEQSIKWQLLFS